MPKVDLGDKQSCPSCGAKFYDLRKRPAQCPKCGFVFDPDDEALRLKRAKARIATYQPALDDEEDEEALEAKAKTADSDEDVEEEVEVTPELDAAVDEPPVLADDEEGEDVAPAASEDLSEGFSEGDLEDVESEGDDVPFIEDDEDFADDDLGELPGEDDEGDGR